MKTLEDLLRMTVKGRSAVTQQEINYPPQFRVSVQNIRDGGVHFIIHADGHNSDTLDFIVKGNTLVPLNQELPHES